MRQWHVRALPVHEWVPPRDSPADYTRARTRVYEFRIIFERPLFVYLIAYRFVYYFETAQDFCCLSPYSRSIQAYFTAI